MYADAIFSFIEFANTSSDAISHGPAVSNLTRPRCYCFLFSRAFCCPFYHYLLKVSCSCIHASMIEQNICVGCYKNIRLVFPFMKVGLNTFVFRIRPSRVTGPAEKTIFTCNKIISRFRRMISLIWITIFVFFLLISNYFQHVHNYRYYTNSERKIIEDVKRAIWHVI